MILPDHRIRSTDVFGATPGQPGVAWRYMIEPFTERRVHENGMSYGLSCAGYDVRVKQDAMLMPGDFALLSTIEHFVMPDYLVATVMDKSSWARRGLALFNTIIEPGWQGWLTIEAKNLGSDYIRLTAGEPIAQIVFQQMLAPAERPYAGKYQNQADAPVPALKEAV